MGQAFVDLVSGPDEDPHGDEVEQVRCGVYRGLANPRYAEFRHYRVLVHLPAQHTHVKREGHDHRILQHFL